MTPEKIELVREPFRRLSPAIDDVRQIFYVRLFETNPELQALFRGDVYQQARALTAMVELIVNILDLQDKAPRCSML